jgi:hypothetical protein
VVYACTRYSGLRRIETIEDVPVQDNLPRLVSQHLLHESLLGALDDPESCAWLEVGLFVHVFALFTFVYSRIEENLAAWTSNRKRCIRASAVHYTFHELRIEVLGCISCVQISRYHRLHFLGICCPSEHKRN